MCIRDRSGEVENKGYFNVNMEKEKKSFFIGHTNISYKVTSSEDNKNCTVTYTIYTNDGFWAVSYTHLVINIWGLQVPILILVLYI